MWLRDPHIEPVSASVGRVLDGASRVTVLALDPMLESATPRAVPAGAERFHDYPVIGKVEVQSPEQRRAIMQAVRGGLRGTGGRSACFNPRHGVQVEANGVVADFVICFECAETWVQAPDGSSGRMSSDDAAHSILDTVLKNGGVKPLHGMAPPNPALQPPGEAPAAER
jgi:hypothetical protein